jgi:hexosaminidase
MYEPVVKVKKNPAGRLLIDFDVEVPAVDVHYSFDNSFPDGYYPSYSGKSLEMPVDATKLRVISYKNGVAVGRPMTFELAELKKRGK